MKSTSSSRTDASLVWLTRFAPSPPAPRARRGQSVVEVRPGNTVRLIGPRGGARPLPSLEAARRQGLPRLLRLAIMRSALRRYAMPIGRTERDLPGLTVLALLLTGPRHTYEMHRMMIDTHKDFVTGLPRTMYHAVERLLRGGMVVVVDTARDGARP